MRRKILQFLMLAALVAVTSVAMADPPARVGRVTVAEGRVTMFANGEEQAGNLMNWPVTTENHLTTAPGARAEFRVGSAAVRLDGDSDIEVIQLDDERLSLRLNYGTASVRVRDPAMLNEFDLTTPQARITLAEPGTFRVETERAPDTTLVNVFGGAARVEGAGNMLTARSGKRVEVRGDEIFLALATRDSFDDWVSDRDRREQNLIAPRYVPSDMTGYEDLDSYGNWVEDREYGTVWYPRAVPVGWAPYRDGRWVWIAPWGWTWVDNSPWGYAPFHYGRWVVVGGRWCWTPGRVVGRPVYSPALVGWVGGNNWSVSFNSGAAPAVGWYPLSPRDRYVPAYRVSVDVERRLAWNHRNNEHWHDRFKDLDHDGRRDGVTAVPREQFDRSRNIPVSSVARVTPQDVRNVPQLAAPPQRQEWQQNRDRFERNDRGADRRFEALEQQRREQQRQQLIQTQPQVQQPQPQQRDERENWRGRAFGHDEQRRAAITTATQQPPQLQAAPPQLQQQPQPQPQPQPQHVERPRFDPRQEQRAEQREIREREEHARREAAQFQMAPARQPQVQLQAPPPAQPAQPQPQVQAHPPSPQQQQRYEKLERRREERREENQERR
jgi:hypothetical protein